MTALYQQIIDYAQSQEPHECCGFVVLRGGEKYFLPYDNIAADPENYFEIAPEDYLRAESQGELIALVHSHPNGEPRLSVADLFTQMACQLDFWLVCDGKIYTFPQIAPLIGRTFDYGVTDCYTLFQDFYRLAGGTLPDMAYDENWWEDGLDLYLDNMERGGFQRLAADEPLQVGDVILIQLGANVANHAAIYLGDQMVLHHAPKRLSKRDLYDGYWLKHTHSIWRHQQWQQFDFTAVLNSLDRTFN